MNANQIIAFLNALKVGELDSIVGKLQEAETACRDLEQDELAERLTHAQQSLRSGDVKGYRKDIESVVSKLGHLR